MSSSQVIPEGLVNFFEILWWWWGWGGVGGVAGGGAGGDGEGEGGRE